MLYFAYGSNMDLDQMTERCPGFSYQSVGLLRGHRLAFTRTSKSRFGGVADVVPSVGDDVWGVVYVLDDPADIRSLDASEGYNPSRSKNAYLRQECEVVAKPGNQVLRVSIYVVSRKESPEPLPHLDYLRQIVKGATQWKLPENYIRKLQAVPCIEEK